ncbi:response regulator transcription factor [Aquabacterium sp.]|uniref:response regulator transcription factor n=1 Tax=Aquabacterium sp. TaxID=1872578 RepID=UPI002CAE38C6|nr:response regulator transcription factor [Aquabacterium sp.]HSW03979.1 response regulator transcription factor [Aquabacterium sp.]
MLRVLVADDHVLVRQGLRQVLATSDEVVLTAEAKNAWEVIERVRQGGIDIVLLDMSMPGPSGVELIRRLRDEAPRVPILVLSMHVDVQIASRAIKAGASGYLTKDCEPETLLEAIRTVGRGGNFIDPSMATRLVFDTNQESQEAPHTCLSNREYQIFLALVRGRGLVDIAEELRLSPKTVSTHKFRLMQKLRLDSVVELARYAMRHGLAE